MLLKFVRSRSSLFSDSVTYEVKVLPFLGLLLALTPVSSAQGSPLSAIRLGQQSANSISGHVFDDQRTPLANLRVELLDEVDSVIHIVKTDTSGLFVFRGLSDGSFQVKVQSSGSNYVSQTRRVELSRPRGFGAVNEEVDVVLVLRRNGFPTAKPGTVFVQEVPELARKQYQRAVEMFGKSEKHAGAMATLERAIEIYPQYFDALEMLGSERVKLQEYDLAVPALSKALEVNARAYPSWYALGVAQYNLKQMPDAVESLRHAVSLKEKSVNANLWLGIVLLQTGRLGEAETYLQQAKRLAGTRLAEPHWQLALLFNRLKRFSEAADELELFLKTQPDSRDAENIKKLIQRFRQVSAGGNKPD